MWLIECRKCAKFAALDVEPGLFLKGNYGILMITDLCKLFKHLKVNKYE